MPESVGEVFQASIMVQNMPLRPSPPATGQDADQGQYSSLCLFGNGCPALEFVMK
jgi:hypothetical protein